MEEKNILTCVGELKYPTQEERKKQTKTPNTCEVCNLKP
jgi:hypothetical protein